MKIRTSMSFGYHKTRCFPYYSYKNLSEIAIVEQQNSSTSGETRVFRDISS